MDPKNLMFMSSHEWTTTDGDELAVGISDHAQRMLGDIVFLELPTVGTAVKQGEEMMTIESPKAAASIYAPVSGEIVAVNDELESSPDLVNQSPYGDGWLVKIRPSAFDADKANLLDHDAYQNSLEED